MPEPVVYRGMALIAPETDSEWHGHFQAAREGRLVIRRCADCQRLRYPPGAGCPWCASLAWTWAPVSGRGTILVTNLVTPDFQPEREERVAIGARVEVCFQPLGPDGALPQFRLGGEPPAAPLWRLPG